MFGDKGVLVTASAVGPGGPFRGSCTPVAMAGSVGSLLLCGSNLHHSTSWSDHIT